MNFSEWSEGPAELSFKNGDSIWILPTSGAKTIKVVMEGDSMAHEVRGGPGNLTLLRWNHDSAYVFGGLYSLSEEDEPDIDTSDIEQLL